MADTPPRRQRRTRPSNPKPPDIDSGEELPPTPPRPVSAPGKGPATLQRKLEMMIVGMGLPFAAVGDEHCATVFAQRGPVVAEAWANLANESPAVKRVLESMLRGGAWTGAIGATCGLLIPVAAHHGVTVPSIPMPGKRHSHTEQEQSQEQSQEPFVDFSTMGNGNGVPSQPSSAPGPAAVSVKQSSNGDYTDPSAYAGNIIPDN